MTYRLYTLVANHYLSPLQHGLQTAHVVGDLSQYQSDTPQAAVFNEWAKHHKTIVILGAGNSAGVLEAYQQLLDLLRDAELSLPVAIFHEDEQSLNGAATACGVVLPDTVFDTKWDAAWGEAGAYCYSPAPGATKWIKPGSPMHNLIAFVKGYRLA
jgi:hypothetical protein